MSQVINGYTYYKLNEVAELADVNARTLRRWIAHGDLEHFLFAYRRHMSKTILFRLEPPTEDDKLIQGEPNTYYLQEESVTNE